MATLEELEQRINEAEEKLAVAYAYAMEHIEKARLATYKRCWRCSKSQPPEGGKIIETGPNGLTNYYSDEWVCGECVTLCGW